MRFGLRRIALALCLAMAMTLIAPVLPAVAAPNDNVLPGVPVPLEAGPSGSLGLLDSYDVYWVQLQRNQELTLRWNTSGSDVTVEARLLAPNAADRDAAPLVMSTSVNGSTAIMRYKTTTPGRYYLVMKRATGAGSYETMESTISTTNSLGKSLYKTPLQAFMHSSTAYHSWVLWVRKGVELTVGLSHQDTTLLYLDLYTDDGTGMPNTHVKKTAHTGGTSKSINMASGDWGGDDYAPVYVNVLRMSGQGAYTLVWYTEPDPSYDERISGRDRFEVARQLGIYTRWPDDSHVSDVVVASGDDAALADPLAAGGLCWAYNAPLLLVSKNAARNAETLIRIQDIRGFSGAVRLHVVGGPVTIPDSVYDSLKTAAGGAAYIERIGGANRYDVARNIAIRMRNVRGDHQPGVLFANGADSSKFFDALALSAISARTGMPILLVKKDSVPGETSAALGVLGSTTPRFVAGGPLTVSESVRMSLGAERWAGSDRYATAKAIADQARARDYLGRHHVAIVSKLPDALSAGADVGFLGGPVLIVKPDALPAPTKAYLEDQAEYVRRLWPVGGPLSIQQNVIDAASSALD